MHRNLLIWATLVLPFAGCTPPQSPAVSDGTILTYLDGPSVQTSIQYVALDDRIVLLIWSDVTGSSDRRSTSSAGGVRLHNESISEDGRKLVWECEALADGSGTLTIGDAKYDLANGFMFLVSTKDGTSTVQQRNGERMAASNIRPTVREWAKEKEITAFFSGQTSENGT